MHRLQCYLIDGIFPLLLSFFLRLSTFKPGLSIISLSWKRNLLSSLTEAVANLFSIAPPLIILRVLSLNGHSIAVGGARFLAVMRVDAVSSGWSVKTVQLWGKTLRVILQIKPRHGERTNRGTKRNKMCLVYVCVCVSVSVRVSVQEVEGSFCGICCAAVKEKLTYRGSLSPTLACLFSCRGQRSG